MKLAQKLGLGLLVLPTLSIFATLIPPQTADAQNATTAVTVVDRSTITYNGQTFFDDDINDDFNYVGPPKTDGCDRDVIKGFENEELEGTNTPTLAFLHTYTLVTGSTDCEEIFQGVNFGTSSSNFTKAFIWIDENTISTSDSQLTFTRTGTTTTFVSNNEGANDVGTSCRDTIVVGTNNQTLTLYERQGGTAGLGAPPLIHDYDWFPFSIQSRTFNTSSGTNGCWEAPAVTNVAILGTSTGGSPDSGAGGASAGISEDIDSCENNSGVLGWILCPVINGLDAAIGWMDTRIQRLLAIDENKYKSRELHQVWVQVRNLAYVLLVPAMLIMVIGTALGFEVFSAYTIKKALPRMVLAVIFITFSWHICIFMITLFNVIGGGVVGIITAPFAVANGGINELTMSSLVDKGSFADTFLSAASVTIGVAILLVFFLGTIVLTVLSAFLVLLLRQMFIVGLMLLAPLAILAWIFPGNDKPWKLWWVSFSRLLLMFPLIAGVIALGRVFAWLIKDGGGGFGDAVLTPLMAIVAYVIPYALIPFTFRLAGGIFATITGIGNDKAKGLFDRAARKRGERWNRTKNFELGGSRNKVARGIGTAAGAIVNPRAAMRGRSGIRAARQAGRANLGAEAFKNDPDIMANQNDDAFLLALAHRGLAEKKLNTAKSQLNTVRTDLAAARASGNAAEEQRLLGEQQGLEAEIANRERGMAAASQVKSRNSVSTRLAAAQALAATGYQLSAGEEGYNELSTIMHDLTGTDSGAYTTAMNQAQYNLKQAQRYDLAGINHGAGYSAETGTGKASLYQLANGKKESIKAMGQDIATRLPTGGGPLTQAQAVEASTLYKELQAMRPNATGAVADEIDKQIEALDAHNVKSYMDSVLMDNNGNPVTDTRTITYDPGNPMHRAGGRGGWTAADVRAGYKTETRQRTVGDLAEQQARTYTRPDPNTL